MNSKINYWWDSCNKWLYIGTKAGQSNQFVISVDNWYWVSKVPTIRSWSVFNVMWDNGAWWGELPDTEEISLPYMDDGQIARKDILKRSGTLPCFVQITILGVGFRFQYDKKLAVYYSKDVVGHDKLDDESIAEAIRRRANEDEREDFEKESK